MADLASFQAQVNSEPTLVLRVDGQLDGVFVLSMQDGAITNIRVVRNPDKLAYLGRRSRPRDRRAE